LSEPCGEPHRDYMPSTMRRVALPRREPTGAFHCPHCGVYAQQKVMPARVDFVERTSLAYDGSSDRTTVPGWWFVFCEHCREESIWLNDRMIYPGVDGGLPPKPRSPGRHPS